MAQSTSLEYVRSEKVWLKDNSEYDENWVRDTIAKDPSLLGLGDITLKDKERLQLKAGRLDLLFEDTDQEKRYEVELMLGRIDECHIIRAIEYWDIEQRRYRDYNHCAVIVAEDITSRFLNVISLLNGQVPLIALQMNAIKINDKFTLHFTKVLDEASLGTDEEDDADNQSVDRSYWEKLSSSLSMGLVDQCAYLLKEIDPNISLTYKVRYIGLAQKNRVNNFLTFHPKKKFLRIHIKAADPNEFKNKFNDTKLEVLGVNPRKSIVKFIMQESEFSENKGFLKSIFKDAYDFYNQ
jgi:hypothetical protein